MLACVEESEGLIGFEQAGFDVVYANEFCEKASITLQNQLDTRDIVPSLKSLILRCQAFSVAGYRQGFDDEKGRGNLSGVG